MLTNWHRNSLLQLSCIRLDEPKLDRDVARVQSLFRACGYQFSMSPISQTDKFY